MRLPDQLPLRLDIERALMDSALPESIPLHPPTAKKVLADPLAATEFVRAWQAYEPQAEVEWVTRRWAHLGQQRVPARVHIGSWERVAELSGQASTLASARSRFAELVGLFPCSPGLPGFRAAAARTHAAWLSLDNLDFTRLTKALTWLYAHPTSGLRPRAVPVEGVDTKWIESHQRLLLRLLKPLGLATLGLSLTDATLRLRFLDPSLAPTPELLDIAVPFHALPLPLGLTVVIVENKETFLALPQAPVGSNALLVFGAGYSGAQLASLDWVRGGNVLYWGDADADGYAILNALRSHMGAGVAGGAEAGAAGAVGLGASLGASAGAGFGCVESVAMDSATVAKFLHLSVDDPGDATRHLPHLTEEEENARRLLVARGNRRLEQERVSLDWALAQEAFAAIWG